MLNIISVAQKDDGIQVMIDWYLANPPVWSGYSSQLVLIRSDLLAVMQWIMNLFSMCSSAEIHIHQSSLQTLVLVCEPQVSVVDLVGGEHDLVLLQRLHLEA